MTRSEIGTAVLQPDRGGGSSIGPSYDARLGDDRVGWLARNDAAAAN